MRIKTENYGVARGVRAGKIPVDGRERARRGGGGGERAFLLH
jgi:hypothetical protein